MAGGGADHGRVVVIVNSDKKAGQLEGLSRNNLYYDYGLILEKPSVQILTKL